ncbi:MAG TPA: T9SS type A sorting domain-containing protein [Taishania sp.]|nr:T9SS type A sorting domain-containing protein [Taishania sp.]
MKSSNTILYKWVFFFQILLVSQFYTTAQLGFEYNPSIPIFKDGSELNNAWAGGLDYTQFSTIDFDFDGDLDLFLFDRSSNNIRLFSNELIDGVRTWKFVYNGHKLFPSDLIYRATTIDYNNDGKNDLFTYSIGGLKVYKNIGNAADGLTWELVEPIVYSNYNGFISNLYVASSDIPAIVDVDFDGDLDILTFNQGGQHLEYHKNMSKENYGTPDSLEFVLANECWGKFSENANNNSILLNDPSYPCENGEISNPQIVESTDTILYLDNPYARHAGSTILALDYDNSGVLDLILGDVSFENLVLLINGGSAPNTNSSMISVDLNFPSNSLPANIYLFPAPFYLDVDFDGIKDLIVGANAKNVSENETSILYYKNTGSNTNPNFVFQKRNFLQDQMIEHGKGSIPTLFDVDGDGLKDLLISNYYRFKTNSTKESSIAWYKNTGTALNPQYTFIDKDWLNLSQQNLGLRIVPCFGDINNDGKDELLIGRENGTITLYQKTGSTFGSPTPLRDNQNNIIQVSSGYAFPQLIDVNNDGLLDLIIGAKNGTIAYYQNTGTASTPSFELKTSQWGGINLFDPNNPDTYIAPHLFKKHDTLHLFVGSIDGKIRYYNQIEGNIADGMNFNLVNPNFLDINVDAFSSVWVEDIDGDDLLNMFIGQDLGGLFHFEVNPTSNVSIINTNQKPYAIYPNPVEQILFITSDTPLTGDVYVYSIDGKVLLYQALHHENQVDLTELPKGMYILHLKLKDANTYIYSIIKE